MCVCSKYNTLRDQLEQTIQMDFPGYKWLSSEQKFIYLLESSNKVITQYGSTVYIGIAMVYPH